MAPVAIAIYKVDIAVKTTTATHYPPELLTENINWIPADSVATSPLQRW